MKKYFTRLSIWAGSIFYVAVSAVAETAPPSNGLSKAPGVDITIQSLFGIITGLACWATRFVMVLMVIMIVWYGFQMMLAQSNETKFKDARKGLNYAVVGMIVILGAYTIIATVGNSIESVGSGDLGSKSEKYTMFVPISCAGY